MPREVLYSNDSQGPFKFRKSKLTIIFELPNYESNCKVQYGSSPALVVWVQLLSLILRLASETLRNRPFWWETKGHLFIRNYCSITNYRLTSAPPFAVLWRRSTVIPGNLRINFWLIYWLWLFDEGAGRVSMESGGPSLWIGSRVGVVYIADR